MGQLSVYMSYRVHVPSFSPTSTRSTSRANTLEKNKPKKKTRGAALFVAEPAEKQRTEPARHPLMRTRVHNYGTWIDMAEMIV